MISPVEQWIAEKTGLLGNLNPETLHNWQCEKLEKQIQYARKNSRFYREKLTDKTILSELPFTSPSDLTNDPLQFLAVPQSLVARVTTHTNSGTTSLQKRIFFTEADLERTVDFFAAGMSSMTYKGENALILISNETENSLGSLLKKALLKIDVTANILGNIQNVNEALYASQNKDCLIGMPAEMLYMSCVDHSLRPKTVLLTADIVHQCVIDRLKEIWKCDVFTHYGHTEFGFGCAVDCKLHNGHHLRDADFIFEIVNPNTDKTANPGESGEIIITTLTNEAMPLIRYRTGNISRFINTPCECGGLLNRLGRIEGRIMDNISISDDKTLSIHQLDEILFADLIVCGFDALLINKGERKTLQLTIDAPKRIDLAYLISKLPQGIDVEVKYGKADPFFQRGKRQIHVG